MAKHGVDYSVEFRRGAGLGKEEALIQGCGRAFI